MTIFFDAPVDPDALTTFVREVPVGSTLELSQAFPSRQVDDNVVDFAEIVKTNRTARYRSFDGRIHVSSRNSGSDTRVPLIPLSSSLNMGEYERLQLQFAKTGGTRTEALANAIYNDGEQLTREVQNRLEQAWGDTLADGKLTINEGGFQGEADFGVPANQLVTAGTAWTDTTNAKVLTDLLAWSDAQNANGNGRPSRMKMSLRLQRLVQRNKEAIDAAYGATEGRTRVRLPDLQDLLSSEGLPTLDTPYDGQVDVDGVATRVVPDDKVIFLPQDLGDLGYTAWGITATALELVNSNQSNLAFEDAAGVVGVVIKDGPPFRQYTFVDAVAMPILEDARRLMVADVF